VMLSARAVFKFVWVLDRKIGRLGAFQMRSVKKR